MSSTNGGPSVTTTPNVVVQAVPAGSSSVPFDPSSVAITGGTIRGVVNVAPKTYHIFAGIDSLTAGAGSPALSYLDVLAPKLRAVFGDGGPGLQMFDNGLAAAEGATIGKAGGTYLNGPAGGITECAYSLNGMGIKWAPGNGTDFVQWRPNRAWDTCTLFYLIQPGGGTFKYRTLDVGLSGPVSTAGALGLGSITFSANRGNAANADYTSFEQITGAVTIFGAFFTLNRGGVTVSRVAQGGITLHDTAALDSTFRKAWLSALQPNLYIINAGTNDRVAQTLATFQADYQRFVGDIVTGSPRTRVLNVQPNLMSDFATSNAAAFYAWLQTWSASSGYDFISNADALGSYAVANTAGDMFDTVHPSITSGNMKIALAMASKLAIPVETNSVLPEPFVPGLRGTVTLVAGSATVAFPGITSANRIHVQCITDGGTPGWLRVSAITAGTSFTITSSSGTDTSVVSYRVW